MDFHICKETGLRYALHFSDSFSENQLWDLKSGINREEICEHLNFGIRPCYSFFDDNNTNEFVNCRTPINFNDKIALVFSDYYPNMIIATLIKEAWENRLGIIVELKRVELMELVDLVESHSYSVALDIISFPVSHPMAVGLNFLSLFSEGNQEEIIEIFETYLKTNSLDYKKLNQIFDQNAYMTPLFAIQGFYYKQPYNPVVIRKDGSMSFEVR